MTTRSFCMLAAAIFAPIALRQPLRIFMELSVTLNGVVIPFWASWVAVIVACALSLVGFRSATQRARGRWSLRRTGLSILLAPQRLNKLARFYCAQLFTKSFLCGPTIF